MIVRNVNDKEVLETTYVAHRGAIAQMILDRRILKEIGFLAIAQLERGKKIEAHKDPMEEIYFILSGEGEMQVDEEIKTVSSWWSRPLGHEQDDFQAWSKEIKRANWKQLRICVSHGPETH
jgi:hypothetical protein